MLSSNIAFKMGKKAFLNGSEMDANPFHYSNDEVSVSRRIRVDWICGYMEEKMKYEEEYCKKSKIELRRKDKLYKKS